MREKKGFYFIGVVSEILELHPHTLREYEKEGLINTKRTKGGVRIYTDDDVNDIRFIKELTHDLGVNLAGVDIILRMRKQIKELHEAMENLEEQLRRKIEEENTKKTALSIREKNQIIEIKIERD